MKSISTTPDRRAMLLRTLGTLLALALLVYLLSQQGWDEIGAALRQVRPINLLIALMLMVISRLAIWMRWQVLLKSADLPISYSQGCRLTFAGLFANNFLPATIGGDIVRLAGAVQLGCDGAVVTASLIVDRLVGMTGMAVTALPGLARVITTHTANQSIHLLAMLSAAAVPPSRSSNKWLRNAWEYMIRLVRRVLDALRLWLKQPKSLLLSFFFTLVNQFCLFGVLQQIFRGLNQSIPFWQIAGLYSLVYFVTLIPISINGYGLQELSMTLIFSTYAGVPVASSITAALLYRTLMMLTSLPGAAFVPGILAKSRQPVPNPGMDSAKP